jgi:membrane protease YdiL (CAAX protease family)
MNYIPFTPSLLLNKPLYTDYIKPVAICARLVVAEVIKCVAVNYFLELSILKLFGQAKKVTLAYSIVRTHVVIAPRAEEILFRGIIQQGLKLCQRKWHSLNYLKKASPEEQKIKKRVRIAVAAALFSMSHLNRQASFNSNLIKLSVTFIAGMNYGFLSEKYCSLSLPILAHGVNNLLVHYAMVERISPLMTYSFVALNQLAVLSLNIR